MKKLLFAAVLLSSAVALAAPEVSSLIVRQLWPFSNKLRVEYQITGATGPTDLDASVTVGGVTTPVTAEYIESEVRSVPAPVSGSLVIDAEKQFAGAGSAVSATVSLTAADASARKYMVIDLSAGKDATSYPVSYLSDVPAGGWTDEYKTTKLVLRRVEAGHFSMGTTMAISGLDSATKDTRAQDHEVDLTHGYYIGVFELTQKQWELVMNTHPGTAQGTGDTLPLYNATWKTIRGDNLGTNWPFNAQVDATSFIGKMRARTSLRVDLPTAAQWEFAARAGCKAYSGIPDGTTAKSIDDENLRKYAQIGSSVVAVGSKEPNNWGLYDVLGNVSEVCVDRINSAGASMSGSAYGNFNKDPVGPVNGTLVWSGFAAIGRTTRGGRCIDTDFQMISLYRHDRMIDKGQNNVQIDPGPVGIRLAVNFAAYPGE